MEKPSEKVAVQGQKQRWKEQEYPTVYSNLMGFGMTPFDINLIFGEVDSATTTEVVGIPRVKLILTPEQAANLYKMLGVAVQAFVANNGALRSVGAIDVDSISKQVEDLKTKVN
jgi:hypothetical protein